MKISSVCRSDRSCSCHRACARGTTPGQCVCVCVCSAYGTETRVRSYRVHVYTTAHLGVW